MMRRWTLAAAAGLLSAAAAHGAGFLLFQHGGRATGQAGAFGARASDPSAIYYNPAAIARLEGFQFQAGLDFGIADDSFDLDGESYTGKHDINFPPNVYLTWKSGDSPFSFGIGVDSPMWHTQDWLPALFPRADLTRRFEARLLQIHPVLAWQFGEFWSFGFGGAYVAGELEDGSRDVLSVGFGQTAFTVPSERSSDADVDGFAWDVALHYQEESWGWGATLRSGTDLSGSADTSVRVDGFVPPGREAAADAAARVHAASFDRLAFELAPELASGIWWAPYPELRLEADVSLQIWSQVDNVARLEPGVESDRDWDDTLSIRLGVEGNITDNFRLAGGVAWEPSPVPTSTLEPGFPRGDAYVYALGAGFDYPWLSFDLGYSLHDHEGRGEPRPDGGRYSASEQVFAVSARWRY